MIKAIILALVVAVAFTAPSEDRMDKVPVNSSYNLRVTPTVSYKSHQYILVIFHLKKELDKLITFLSNQLKAEITTTQLLYGSTEDQDVHHC